MKGAVESSEYATPLLVAKGGEVSESSDMRNLRLGCPLPLQAANEEKRARVEAELQSDPGRSDRAIADVVGVAHNFVGRTRTRLESTGVVSSTTPSGRASTNGKIGEGQKKGQPTVRH
jgi:hypothetical protein